MQIWLSFCAYFYGRKWWLSSQLAYRCQFFIGFVNLRSDISNLADDYNTQMLIVDINKNEYNSNAYESHKINTSISQRYQNKCNNKIFSIQTFMREQKTCKNIPKTWPAFFSLEFLAIYEAKSKVCKMFDLIFQWVDWIIKRKRPARVLEEFGDC